jgi:hypothetical protein
MHDVGTPDSPAVVAYQEWLSQHGYERSIDVSMHDDGSYAFADDALVDDFLGDHPTFEKAKSELDDWDQNNGPFTNAFSDDPTEVTHS